MPANLVSTCKTVGEVITFVVIKAYTMESTIKATTTVTDKITPKELIWKHIQDPTHIITEEEFNRIIIGDKNDEVKTNRRRLYS